MTRVWNEALDRISERIAGPNFEMWLRPIECLRIDGTTIWLRAPNPYVRLWFESNYLDVILDELRTSTSVDYEVEFEVELEVLEEDEHGFSPERLDESASDQTPDALAESSGLPHFAPDLGASLVVTETARPAFASASMSLGGGLGMASTGGFSGPPAYWAAADRHGSNAPSGKAGQATPGASGDESSRDARGAGALDKPQLNPRYTFDSFVSGPSNQLAYAAAQAAARAYPPKYNPIFICGGVGLGKTHLLHAIGQHFLATRPGTRILYLSGERFMNEYIQAIRTNEMHEFRARYREHCDVLLVDDVQFLAGKDGTQDEFFHTFNALHDSHRQIVLTADRKPNEISDIADRLRSRFAWGLLADIEPPELEVRVAILRKKAESESIDLPDDVALYIATAIKSNVRELEGALIRLAAQASLLGATIDMAFARSTLEGSIAKPREHVSAEAVIKSVAHYYGLKVGDIKSSRRHKSVAGPRAVAMYLARTHTDDSYPDLGRAFGGKHHTTVISAVEKISKRLRDEPGLRSEIHAIEAVLLR